MVSNKILIFKKFKHQILHPHKMVIPKVWLERDSPPTTTLLMLWQWHELFLLRQVWALKALLLFWHPGVKEHIVPKTKCSSIHITLVIKWYGMHRSIFTIWSSTSCTYKEEGLSVMGNSQCSYTGFPVLQWPGYLLCFS